jgi:hypothetical protein
MRLTREAVEYGFRELARRAGVRFEAGRGTGFDAIGVACVYGEPSEAPSDRPALVVRPCDPEDWVRLLALRAGAIPRVPARDAVPAGARPAIDADLPILFRGRGPGAGAGFARREGRTVVLDCDVVAAAVILLTRWEETVIADRDEHGRMPVEASAAFRQGFLDRPLVDEYALAIREWLRALVPDGAFAPRRFEVQLSHDVDAVRRFDNVLTGGRIVAGHLVKRRELVQAARDLRVLVAQVGAPRRTDSYRGLFRLEEISKRHGFRGAFFFMTARAGSRDTGYNAGAAPIREAIGILQDEGFEIGFHPSYRSHDDFAILAEEKERLDAILGRSAYGGRQHFLRFAAPETWRRWERVGLTYDSTLTFAGREGFRCGTCHPYPPFDLDWNRELRLLEVPLIVMDGTLRQYRRLTPSEALSRVETLAQTCRAVHGTFTLLWHNSSLAGEWNGWAEAYEQMVARLAALSAPNAAVPRPAAGEHDGARSTAVV